MAIVVAEKYKGRRRNGDSAEVVYLVEGTESDATNVFEDDAIDAVLGTSGIETFGGIPLQDVDARNELVQGTWWEVAAIYSLTSPTFFNTGSVQYEFSFTAPVGRVYYSLETRSITGADDFAWPTNSFGNKIRGQGDDEEGIDLPNPSPTNSWIFNIAQGSVTTAYQQGIEAIMGSVNSTNFKGRAADTMRLIGCNGGARNDKDWSIRFDFQFSANRSNVVLNGITVPSIHGHNLVWDYSKEETITVDSEEHSVRRPTAIVVERVFERVNFSVLGF